MGRCVKVGGVKFFAISEQCEVTIGLQARERYEEKELSDAAGWAQAAR